MSEGKRGDRSFGGISTEPALAALSPRSTFD
jgi:hypothetical protein